MGAQQTFGLIKKPFYGIDYESAIKAQSDQLPALYVAKEQAESAADAEKYLQQISSIQNAEQANAIAQDNKSNLLGLLSTGLTAYKTIPAVSTMVNSAASGLKDFAMPAVEAGKGIAVDAVNGLSNLTVDAINGLSNLTGGVIPNIAPAAPTVSSATPGVVGSAAPIVTETAPVLAEVGGVGAGAEVAGTAGMTAAEIEAMNAGIDTVTPAIMSGTGASTAAPGTISTLSKTVGPVAAIIGGAEMVRSIGGAPEKSWDDKSYAERIMDSPVTAGMFHTLMFPGVTFADENTAPGKAFKEMSRLERDVMAPIDLLMGDPNAMKSINKLSPKDSTTNALAALMGNPYALAKLISKALCIIVTVCTNPESYEVNIAREYRDKFLTPGQLRGYYMIAEKLVPRITKSSILKTLTKKLLVDRLIKVGEYRLCKTSNVPSLFNTFVTDTFLWLCAKVGSTKDSYTRSNGEIV